MKVFRKAAVLLSAFTGAALFLSACGFEPMYGARATGGSTADDLATIEVAPIRDRDGNPYRLGQMMSNALGERLYPSGIGATRYRLELLLDREREGFGFRPDEAVTRYGLRLTARYRLIDLASGAMVLEETARSYNSYDVVQSDFATMTAERDMENRLTKDLSERISGRLSLYFRDQRTPDSK